ncbi:MAG: DNA polymerase I [Nitrospirae bacterium]|nr:MAG: DNA polymerase I [Nitrospirota bacterium]
MKQASLFDQQPEPQKRCAPQSVSSSHSLKELAFDVEATGSNPLRDQIVGISLCREHGKAYYVPVRHSEGPNLPEAFLLLRGVLEDAAVAKIGHNLKFDTMMLRREGIEVSGLLYDTMVASYLLNPNKPNHSLEEVGLEYLQHRKRPFLEVLGKRASFADVPLAEAVPYAAEDAALALELKGILFPMLEQEGLSQLYFDIEMPLIRVLADIESAGVKIDLPLLHGLSKELERELDNLQAAIYRVAGQEFNINSPKQLAKVLFEDLGLKPGKKTKTGFSTSVDVLEDLAHQHELPAHILGYRTLHKLKTTYIDTLPLLADPGTKRIHTSFNQTVTATGRLSSSEPNLQNIPVRTDWGTRIRGAFIAEEGHVLLSADYSQIELRILAHMSGDEGLLHAFRHTIDVHARTASELFQKPVDEVSADERRFAKTINFGVIYGMSAYGLSEALSIAPKEAAEFIHHYFATHPGVKAYIEKTIETARRQGYVSTLLGRKRHIPDIGSSNINVRQAAERIATNTPLQGTAADLIKIAMIRIHTMLKTEKLRTKMVLQIHDELLFEVQEDELDILQKIVRHEMEGAMKLAVPLKVDMGWGQNWAEAH